MKKLFWVIVVIGLLAYLSRVWTAEYCKDVVKESNLTGSEATAKYEECLVGYIEKEGLLKF